MIAFSSPLALNGSVLNWHTPLPSARISDDVRIFMTSSAWKGRRVQNYLLTCLSCKSLEYIRREDSSLPREAFLNKTLNDSYVGD